MNTESPPRFGAVGRPAIAWAVILLVVAFTIASNQWRTDDLGEDAQALELLLLRLQSQYIVGASRLTDDSEAVLKQVSALNVGSITRRQRYIALVAEIGGPHVAELATGELDELLMEEEDRGDEGHRPRDAELVVQQIFRDLFVDSPEQSDEASQAGYAARLATISEADRELLREELGWFAGAILAPEGTEDTRTRESFLAPTLGVTVVILGGFLLAAAAGFAGLAILITMAVLAFRGRVRSGLQPAQGHHGVYAETFAIWIASFIVLSLVGGLISLWRPSLGLWPSLVTFLASLLVLRWPVYRGIPWETVKRDIGLYSGERPWIELLAGAGGYLAALPLLAMGMLCTMLLLTLQGLFLPEVGPFEAAAGPAHPIVFELAESSIWLKLQVLLLASVAAPLVEETMFRGVLYRYLREASRRRGVVWSVVISGGVSSLLFAAIHPQGWVAIPALMSLAFSFVLLREWRGSLLPSMVLHGISNGVVMTGLLVLLQLS